MHEDVQKCAIVEDLLMVLDPSTDDIKYIPQVEFLTLGKFSEFQF